MPTLRIPTLDELKEILKNSEDYDYDDITLFDEPVDFAEWAKDKDYEVVQLRSIQTYENNGKKHILGFCGLYRWVNNEITSLDGDYYDEHMKVYGFEKFLHDGKECVEILVL